MSTSAFIMMMISIMVLWGGLAIAMVHLSKHPDPKD